MARVSDSMQTPELDSVTTLLKLLTALLLTVVLLFGADWMLRTENFPVRNVRFEGEFSRVTEQQLGAAVWDAVRGNFFLVDLDAVKRRVESLPWVYRVSVQRHWPWDIHVNFVEQKLVARWGDVQGSTNPGPRVNGSAWVNRSGEVVKLAAFAAPANLPQLDGPEGTASQVLMRYRRLTPMLESAGLRLTRLVMTPRRSWRLELDANGHRIAVILDREAPDKKLTRFVHVYVEQLARRPGAIKQVDLRYANGFSVEWDRGVAVENWRAIRGAAVTVRPALAGVRRSAPNVTPAASETMQAALMRGNYGKKR